MSLKEVKILYHGSPHEIKDNKMEPKIAKWKQGNKLISDTGSFVYATDKRGIAIAFSINQPFSIEGVSGKGITKVRMKRSDFKKLTYGYLYELDPKGFKIHKWGEYRNNKKVPILKMDIIDLKDILKDRSLFNLILE